MILRDAQVEDLAVFFEQQCEPEALEMADISPRDRDSFLAYWTTKVLGNRAVAVKVIVLDGAVAGYVTAWRPRDKRLVGYWLGKAYWGRGLATAAVGLFLRQDAARPLFAIVPPRNVASIRVLEKCGFERVTEPSERESVLDDDDDGVLMTLR